MARRCYVEAPHGMRSTADLRACGVGEAAVPRLVRAGVLERVTDGWFALAEQDLGPSGRLARLGLALEQRLGERAVASHHTALALMRLPLVEVAMDVAHLTYRTGGKYRRRSDHVVHAAPRGVVLPDTDAMPTAEALTQTGITWGLRPYVVAADAALARGLVTPADLAASASARRFTPGAPVLARGLELLDARSESPGESLLRLGIVSLGLNHPVVSQVEVTAEGRRYRLDFALAGTRVGIEFDGVGKYADPTAIRAEKNREERLRTAGWILVRFQWADLFSPGVLRQRINWALAVDEQRRPAASA